MRRTCTILVTCALLLGFVEAPFAHIHEQAFGEDHHATEQVHAHARHLAANTPGPAFDQIDPADDERAVNWFQTVQQTGFILFITPQQTELIEPPAAREFVRAAPSTSSHDPPRTSHLPARAPPVIPA